MSVIFLPIKLFNPAKNKRKSDCYNKGSKNTGKKKNRDQCQYLGNCPLTPPLIQQQSIDNKFRLMLG